MDDVELLVREGLRDATSNTPLSAGFWSMVERRARIARRRRTVQRSLGAAATLALVTVLGAVMLDRAGAPPVLAELDAPPARPVVVAEGELASGERWKLSVAGPAAWPQAGGEAGELCTRVDLAVDEGARGNSVNCAPPDSEVRVFDSVSGLFVLRDAAGATTLELLVAGRTVTVPMQVVGAGRFPATWAVADISRAPRLAEVERLAVVDREGVELWWSHGPASPESGTPP
ncbi:MAG: hypothetical protein KG028_13960 [Actinobacteria bacterium]|jgi:hypothetical protein|nr:hypothetical protein [Actinomycetota bacterium]